jgi:uncharacterized protein YndB with AHSA1/START domain
MTSCILIAVRVKASPERAFEVFTREIGSWWRPSALFRTTSQGDGVIAFEGGRGGRIITTLSDGTVFEIGRITTWAPGEKLAFTWRPDTLAAEASTDVEVRFEAAGDETRVTVEHRGWAEVPREHAARHGFPERAFLERAAEWWRGHLDALRARCA